MARRATRVRRDRAFFERLVARREREGLTWGETARAGGVALSTLHRWTRRLREEDAPGFVDVGSLPAAPTWVEVVLANGRAIRLPAGAPPAGLQDLVLLLERGC